MKTLLRILLLAVSVTTLNAHADLISRWTFDEAGGAVAADSVASRDGTLVGDATFVAGGVSGNAVQMSRAGSGYIDFGDILAFNNGDFSFSIWVKMEEGDTSEQLILGRESANTGGYFLRGNTFLESYGTVGKAFFFAGTGTQASGPQPISATSINDGQWHHVVVTYAATGETRLYIDGVFEAATDSVDIPFADTPFRVGGYISAFLGDTADFDGLVDELAVYNDVLSDSEVAALFTNTPGNTATLTINPGLNDAWYNPDTAGQGFYIVVFGDSIVSLAWFTFDTEQPPADLESVVGDPGNRWLTALGNFSGTSATMDVFRTSGGAFDSMSPMPSTEPIGTLTLTFDSCTSGQIAYDLTDSGLSGVVPIQRVVDINVPLCEELSGGSVAAED